MWSALLLLLTACLGSGDDERLVMQPFEGRMMMVRANRTMGEIVSSRTAADGRATTVLLTANLGSQPGVSEPSAAVFAVKLEIDCEEGSSRVARQQIYGRDGTLKGSVDLDNQFAANEDLTGLISDLCEGSAEPAEGIGFETLEEYWALVQREVRGSRPR